MAKTLRRISKDLLWKITLAYLGRMACMYGDPTNTDHAHTECVRDDEAYAAELVLRLVAAVVTNDDDLILERLEEIRAAIATSD